MHHGMQHSDCFLVFMLLLQPKSWLQLKLGYLQLPVHIFKDLFWYFCVLFLVFLHICKASVLDISAFSSIEATFHS